MTKSGVFDLMDPELIRDPFAGYARIRECPGLTRGVIPGADPVWLATRYDDVRLVMSDRRFVNDPANVPGADAANLTAQIQLAAGIAPEDLKYLHPNMSTVDGSDHHRLRALVSRAFTVRRVEALRPSVEQITEDLLDRLPESAEDGVVDLLPHFAYPLPITVIGELVGVPAADRAQWRTRSGVLATGFGPGIGAALRGMVEHTAHLIEWRRGAPADDLISGLIQAQDEDGDRLGDDEMITLVMSLVVAGYETTAHLIGNGTAALLRHPDQLALLRERPELLPRAVPELMRWCGPSIGTFVRYATEDVEVGGTLVRRGAAVMPVLAAGNRDPRRFDDPDRLDITREPGRETHLGFGHGPHYCLGAALARQEGEVAFAALLRRFPRLALAVAPEDLERGPNPGSWQLAALPVRL